MNSNDLNEILQDHSQKLVVVMYSSQSCGPCINFKPRFTAFAKSNTDCFFVYVDINNFKDPKFQFLSEVKGTPKFSFYFNGHMVGDILGADDKVFVETLEYLKGRINDRYREIEQQELANKKHKMEEENNLKIELLKKLYELQQRGIKVTPGYNMNTPVDKLMWEYNTHMKNLQLQQNQQQTQQQTQPTSQTQQPTSQTQQPTSSIQQPTSQTQQPTSSIQQPQTQEQPQTQQQQPVLQTQQSVAQSTLQSQQQILQNQQTITQEQLSQMTPQEQLEHIKKQEKMDKIRELKRIHQMMQMEQFLKLEKLKQLKNMKQQKEHEETESESSSSEHEEN